MSVQVGQTLTATASFNAPLQDGSTVVWSGTSNVGLNNQSPVSAGNQSSSIQVTGRTPGAYSATCNVTNPDGTSASGTGNGTVVAPPPPNVTGVTVTVP
jgi:plastocyanin domain-containing protein